MSVIQVNRIVDASGGVLAPISSVMRNRLIDAGFTINQRGYVSGTALSAGAYAHDRFKAGASGCTYTFTQLSTGVPIVITITAGSLQQVIEGANMPEGGTYVLSWTGTAQAKFNGGAFGNSPLAVTGITAGANTTIEFGTGTCSFPQLEVGTQATGYEYRQYQQELALCQRYASLVGQGIGYAFNTTLIRFTVAYPIQMRTSPTLSALQGTFRWNGPGVYDINSTNVPTIAANDSRIATVDQAVSGAVAGIALATSNGGAMLFSAEL